MTNERLCQIIAEGDSDELIPLLWDKVRNLYYMLAEKRYISYKSRAKAAGVELSDCKQQSYFAFLAALRDYNKEPREQKFTSFAAFHVKNEVNSLLGLRTERAKNEPLSNCTSLDTPLSDSEDNGITFGDTVQDEAASVPFENVEQDDISRVVRDAVAQLTDRQREVIRQRYFDNSFLDEISERLHISRERARQIELSALRTLRSLRVINELGRDLYGYSTGLSAFKQNTASSVELAVERRERLGQWQTTVTREMLTDAISSGASATDIATLWDNFFARLNSSECAAIQGV